MTFDKNGFGYGVAYNSGAMILGTVSIVGRLLVGLLMLAGKKTILEGGPGLMEAGQWLKEKATIFFVKCYTFIKPHTREVGRILIALLIIVVRKLEMKTKPKIVATGQFIGVECTELVRKCRTKLMQKIIVGRRNPSTPEIGEVVNPSTPEIGEVVNPSTPEIGEVVNASNLSLDQSVPHDKEFQK